MVKYVEGSFDEDYIQTLGELYCCWLIFLCLICLNQALTSWRKLSRYAGQPLRFPYGIWVDNGNSWTCCRWFVMMLWRFCSCSTWPGRARWIRWRSGTGRRGVLIKWASVSLHYSCIHNLPSVLYRSILSWEPFFCFLFSLADDTQNWPYNRVWSQTAIPFLIGTKYDQFATFPRDEQEEITKQVRLLCTLSNIARIADVGFERQNASLVLCTHRSSSARHLPL